MRYKYKVNNSKYINSLINQRVYIIIIYLLGFQGKPSVCFIVYVKECTVLS